MFGLLNKKKQLLKAIEEKNSKKIHSLIENGVDVNVSDDKSNPIIFKAIASDSVEIFKALLNAGVNIESRDINEKTLLMLAVQNSNLEITSLLINKDVKLESKDNFGDTALIIGVRNLRYSYNKEIKHKIISILVEAGADIHTKTSKGISSLDLAYEITDINLIKILLGNTNEFGFKDIDEIFIPCLKNIKNEANNLLERSQPNMGSIDGRTVQFTRSSIGSEREERVNKPFNRILVQIKLLLPDNSQVQEIQNLEIEGLQSGRVITPGAEVEDCKIALKNVNDLLEALKFHS